VNPVASEEVPTGAAGATASATAGGERVRAGALPALLQDLVRGPEGERGAEWHRALGPGAVIGRFELGREVGRGGFGVVYEARDRELGRQVAFKAVRAGARQEVREERLLREAETAARLSHPNIVTLFDVGRAPEGPYLIMELLRGRTLARRIEQGIVPLREALRIAVEVAKGLAHAHAQGVIHRDLTPGNIFLCEDGQVKVLDLGLAHVFGHRKVDGGTPAHMAPEQRRGAPEDERTDVFAMGVALFEMVTGEVPFPPDGGRPLPESAGAPSLDLPDPSGLTEFIARMLSVDPVDRPRDAGEVLTALTSFQQEVERAPPSDAPPRPALPCRPSRRLREHSKPERTWLCSILCADILRYSEQAVELQATWKERFDAYLARSIRELPETDRVILHSGGTVTVCFLGDPEDAIACALGLLHTVVREERVSAGGMAVRIGMHLGPVRLLRDINGNLNALGDGVQVARRVMGFAGDNQSLVSRSFHDVASCLSEVYRPLFTSGGLRRDEQAREHAIFELHLPATDAVQGDARLSRPEQLPDASLDPAIQAAIEGRAAAILGPIARHLARTVVARTRTPRELAEALAAFMPVSGDREHFLRSLADLPTPPAATAGSPVVPPACSPAALERAGRELAAYMGPLARILVSRASARARSEEELYDLLAAEITSPKEREAFRKRGPASSPRRC
jgi:serine/threonine protein kinase